MGNAQSVTLSLMMCHTFWINAATPNNKGILLFRRVTIVVTITLIISKLFQIHYN